MKLYQKLDRFPLGSIRAEGFLKEQMELGKDGMAGHLYELEPGMIADPYVHKTYVPAWGDGDQSGWGAEISGNYWYGYIQHAYTMNDPEMIAVAENWVAGVLKNQKADGYLGTYFEEDADIYDDYNAWGTSCGMRGLLAFYEATGRKDVLDAVYRCMLWFCDKWAGDQKSSYAGIAIIEPMVLTYYYTGDERLMQFCEDYLDFQCRNDLYKVSYKSMLSDDFFYHSMHSAAIGGKGRLPALVYTVTGNEDYLEATEKHIRKMREHCIQLTGGPVSSTEYLGPVGSTMDSEYCCFTTLNLCYSFLSYITGKACYGDYMEEVFYNAAQGARKKDERAIAYLTAPNQIYATKTSSRTYNDQHVYAPCYPTACCPVNAVAIVPDFIRGMLLRDDEDNVHAFAYGPCSLRYKDIALTEKTNYPFRNRVEFVMECEKEFSLYLKLPAWSKGYQLCINGESVQGEAAGESFVCLRRNWKQGDTVAITFTAEIEVIHVDDSDCASKFPLAFKYGALLFSYHIPEKWMPIPGRPMTPLPEGWSWFDVNPDYEEADCADAHERIGRRRDQFTWNVAVDEVLTADDFTVEEIEPSGYAWSHPMIQLHTHCYKAPYLCAPYANRTFEPIGAYQYVTDRLPLTLVPFGCTNLRITYFPKADLKNRK